MAKREFVSRICNTLNMTLSEIQTESVCRQTPNEFDEQWVIDQLALKGNVTATMIIRVINSAPTPAPERCDRCSNGVVTSFDHKTYQIALIHGAIISRIGEIPLMSYSCPNCGTHKDRLQKSVNSMTTEEQGWAFVALYDFYAFTKQGTDHWKDFNPADYWQDVYIDPELSAEQIQCLEFTYRGIKSRGVMVPDAPVKIQKLAATLANAASAPF